MRRIHVFPRFIAEKMCYHQVSRKKGGKLEVHFEFFNNGSHASSGLKGENAPLKHADS